MTTLTFDRRFRGPLTSVNGGYAAGTLAAYLDDSGAPVEVTLRLPPPLDTPVEVDRARLVVGDQVIAEARPVELEVEPPAVSQTEAAEARRRSQRWGDPAFAECFSCGVRAEGDNLAIHPGPLVGREDVKAAPWVAREVSLPVLWSAIDCVGAYAMAESGRGSAVLGRMTARADRLPEEGEPCVVVGWPIERDGRKLHAGTALLSADTEVLAVSRQVWIAPR